MDLPDIQKAVSAKIGELRAGVRVPWRIPRPAPPSPIDAPVDPAWPQWEPGDQFRAPQPAPLQKGARNWLYGEITLPAKRCGLAVDDRDALLFIQGWIPFTLWFDGQELYQETHAWHAAGPIADPTPVSIAPGTTHRVVVCLEPNDLPVGAQFLVEFKSQRAEDVAIQLAATGLELGLGEALCRTDAERRRFQKATGLLDLAALAGNDFDGFTASVGRFERAAAFLSPRIKDLTVHLVGHTHIDMDWMWTWEETVHCVRRDVKAVLDLMDDYPEVTFTHSQVPTYQIIQEQDPDLWERLKHRVAEGRWECAAGTWVEGDLNMADGESVARQMLYAKAWTQANLGVQAKVLWEPDTFGHPGNMPQLAKLGGFDQYFHWRCNPGRHDDYWPVRTWEGIDGTGVIASSQCYGGGLLGDWSLSEVINYAKRGYRHALNIWGLGDHGGGLPRWHLRAFAAIRDRPLVPTCRFSTMAGYLAAIRQDARRFPRNRGEVWTLFAGCFTTHASIKSYNRRGETALLTAESLSVLAWRASVPRAASDRDDRATLRTGWQTMLFNQFHDILDGAAVHDSYQNAHQRAEAALAAAGRVTAAALDTLAPASVAGRSLTLINPLGFARTEPVRVSLPADTVGLTDERGRFVPVQKLGAEFVFVAQGVPAFGARSYRLERRLPRGVKLTAVTVTEDAFNQTYRIESAVARSQLSKLSGAIVSYRDCTGGADYVAYGIPRPLEHVYCTRQDLALNVFQVIDESPNTMSAWLINDIVREENLLRKATVSLVETGPVFARFKVEHQFRQSRITEEILYYHQFPRVDFEVHIDWRERGGPETGVPQLKLSFATTVAAATARFEGPYTVIARPTDGTEQPTQKFLDVSAADRGFTLYNDSKYGADVLGGRARVTLLRNPYSPDPETDNGQHVVRLAFAPHAGPMTNGDLVRGGMAFNRPLLARVVRQAPPAPPRFRIDGAGGVVCTALRHAEHSAGVLVRLFEANGQPGRVRVSVPAGYRRIQVVDLLENPVRSAVRLRGGRATVALRPFEVKTLLLER